MASGDAAAAQGFTPVLATDDFRLGYQRINDVADFASTRVRYFTATSLSAMNAITGMKRGDLCYRTDELIEYKYDAAWRQYRSGWIDTIPGFDQIAYNAGFVAKYRWVGGKVRYRFSGTIGSTSGSAGRLGVPVAPDTSVEPMGMASFDSGDASQSLPITRLLWNNAALSYYYPSQVNPTRQTVLNGQNVAVGWKHVLILEYDAA